MKKILLFLLGFSLSVSLYSHPWKPNHYIIIDTDGGIDDIRAITMLLASPDVRVLGIIVSPGALDIESSYKKVKSLLNSFHHEGIPVAVNRMCNFKSPLFQAALNTIWGEENGISQKDASDFRKMTESLLPAESTKVSFICLGGLTSASILLKETPSFEKQVKEIIWSADGVRDTEGFNYNIDRIAARKIMNGQIPVKIVRAYGETAFFDSQMESSVSAVKNQYSQKISVFFKSEAASHSFARQATDEMIPLYLHFPKLFLPDTTGRVIEYSSSQLQLLRDGCIKILDGETVAKNQVVKHFPPDPAFYSDDVAPFVTEIINKYGADEWVSGVIANELHRHLGVFAIVGVKMGIRAREYFNTGVDEFRAVSFAGSVPPLSCMNDGIQVSTGATPGHGLLSVKNDSPATPCAEFTYLGRKLKVTLKPEYADKISSELNEINFVYGLDSNIYWELVRKNSIKYWLSMDRHDIFILEETESPGE